MSKKKALGPWTAETVCILGDEYTVEGWQVMDESETQIAEFTSHGGFSKAACRRLAMLVADAPRMRNDIDAFIAAMEDCDSRDEAVKIAKDFYKRFTDVPKKAKVKA